MWIRSFSSKGFTLLEIIICLGLIATALLAVFQLQAQNLELQSESRFITTAHHLSQERLARIRNASTLLPGNSSGDFGEGFSQYVYREDIMSVPGVENLYKVNLRIRLATADAASNYEVETYLFRP
jgi:prepilin-type N-terminal cleavage/methylation domain-containing protein